MSLVFDEYGRPFIILREQQQKSRIKGIEAQKANILAARSVSNLLRTSLGPKGTSHIESKTYQQSTDLLPQVGLLNLNELPNLRYFLTTYHL
jgi:hypothetical protein